MQRPAGITILASLYFFTAGIVGLGSILLIFGRSFFSGIAGLADAGPPSSARDLALAGLFFLVVAFLDLICGIGFIKLKKWSRVLAIVFHVAWAVFWALSFFGLRMHPSLSSTVFRFSGLAIQVGILVYLFSSPVKRAFAGQKPETR
jgi:uncharacterized membrane protein (DUF2068 family)